MATSGGMVESTAYNVLANPIGDEINKFWTRHVADPLALAWDKTVHGYYDFIGWSFKNLTHIITTFPVELFNQPQIYKLQGVFMGYSVVMVTILTMLEGMKAVFGHSYTKLTSIIGRTFFGLIAAGLTVPALIFLMNCANMVVDSVMAMGQQISDSESFGQNLLHMTQSGGLDFVASLLFMIAFFYFVITALFKVGQRWFDMLMNMVSSPFAWAAYATEGTTKYLTSWLTGTGQLLLINVVYSFYVLVLSTIVMLPVAMDSAEGYFARLLLILGGLYRLAHPPAWLSSMGGGGSLKSSLKEVYNLVSGKKFRNIGKK